MQPMRPCSHCEQELPEAAFPAPDAIFCKRCTREVTDIIRRKYSIIEAAYFRAKVRHKTRQLRSRIRPSVHAAAGD